jgi:hypothetical protein
MTPSEVRKVFFQLFSGMAVYTACIIAATVWAEGVVTRHIVGLSRVVYEAVDGAKADVATTIRTVQKEKAK